jgi:hypothetical protein
VTTVIPWDRVQLLVSRRVVPLLRICVPAEPHRVRDAMRVGQVWQIFAGRFRLLSLQIPSKIGLPRVPQPLDDRGVVIRHRARRGHCDSGRRGDVGCFELGRDDLFYPLQHFLPGLGIKGPDVEFEVEVIRDDVLGLASMDATTRDDSLV